MLYISFDDVTNISPCVIYAFSEDKRVMDGHRDRVFAVKYHFSNAAEFITGGWDDTVQFWDTRNKTATRLFNCGMEFFT